MPLSVHIIHEPDPEALDHLRAALRDDVTLTFGEEPPHDARYEVLVTGRPTRAMLTQSPDVRAVVIPWAGMTSAMRELMLEFPDLAVHNLHHNAIATAEMTLALLFAAAKGIVPADRDLRRGDWSARYEPAPAFLLYGKTALILGYGAIGQHVGQVLEASGMDVLATRRSVTKAEEHIYPPSVLHELLPRADVLVITLPLTDETEGLIGADELALLPHGSLLVNVGRGPIVDQHALYDALQAGSLAAAALDVWYTYPRETGSRTDTLPADAPLHTLENLVLSPHRAGMGGDDAIERMRMDSLAEVLNALAAGDHSVNRVNVAVGY